MIIKLNELGEKVTHIKLPVFFKTNRAHSCVFDDVTCKHVLSFNVQCKKGYFETVMHFHRVMIKEIIWTSRRDLGIL